jgi:hypothetical protein
MSDKKLTPEFKEALLGMLAELPNITVVCKLMGIHFSNFYRAREKDPNFDQGVKEAMEQGYDLIEEEARRRAVDGVLEPVFYRGEEVGAIRKYSDQLLITLLKGYKPRKFAPGVKITAGTDGEKVSMVFNLGGD